jgi:hypothetical protein
MPEYAAVSGHPRARPLDAAFEEYSLPLRRTYDGLLAVPAQSRTRLEQVHYYLQMERGRVLRLSVPVSETPDAGMVGLSVPLGFPSLLGWRLFCIGPHSLVSEGPRRFHVGQRCFPRFLVIDLAAGRVLQDDPGLGDEFLSCTNWVDPQTRSLWFASWPFEDTLRRETEPGAPVRVTIWERRGLGERPQERWQGALGDLLHQLNISPDRERLLLCEMGMRARLPAPPGHPGTHPREWREFQQGGVFPSEVLSLDLRRGNEWRFQPPVGTAAHVEFSLQDPSVLSQK